jgi:hypothetical protein
MWDAMNVASLIYNIPHFTNILIHKKWQTVHNLLKHSAIYQYILLIFIFEYYYMELINFMEQNHSWAANSGSAIQEIPLFFWNPKSINLLTSLHLCSLSRKIRIQSIFLHAIFLRIRFDTALRLVPRCSRWSRAFHICHARNMSGQSCLPLFDYSSNI